MVVDSLLLANLFGWTLWRLLVLRVILHLLVVRRKELLLQKRIKLRKQAESAFDCLCLLMNMLCGCLEGIVLREEVCDLSDVLGLLKLEELLDKRHY